MTAEKKSKEKKAKAKPAAKTVSKKKKPALTAKKEPATEKKTSAKKKISAKKEIVVTAPAKKSTPSAESTAPPVKSHEPKVTISTAVPAPKSTPEPKPKKEKVPVKLSTEEELLLKQMEEEEDRKRKAEAAKIKVKIPITVGALAELFGMKPGELISQLIQLGVFANINQLLSDEVVFKVAAKLSKVIEKEKDEAEKVFSTDEGEDKTTLKLRPPVVTLMGHVDHGKTSLLDAIRQSNVAGGEAGKITQHIGAYMVDIPNKGHVTFLDTPGHEAFTAIRARGANVTDVVVLVVAADDGVMPQTVEAINHARDASCPIVVAVNKSDLPTANPQRVMQQLQQYELVPEEWGGKTIFVNVSAKTGAGIDKLLELLILEAEMLDLKANPDTHAKGTILEAKLTKGQGAVSTVLVQRGTLRIGDMVVAGPYYGRVRAMKNDRGKNIKEASVSHAVEMHGLPGVCEAGELFSVVESEALARQIAEKRELENREKEMHGAQAKHFSLQQLHSKLQEGQLKELKLIIKADAQGSLEGLTRTLTQAVSDKISVRVIHGGIGGVNESDVMLAMASDAVIIGFHVKADVRAQTLIEKEGIDARFYRIIYEAAEDVLKAMEGLLEPAEKEVVEGRVEVRQVFKSSKIGNIGGAIVTKGRVARSHHVRLIRDNIVVFDGKLASLKRFKDDAREVQEGYECGIVLAGFDDLQPGDIVEAYRLEKVASKLI
ncbi:MAG: translation initiation factor IF-2 [Candidatus Omnitrophica bacterium CG11_big_fil_rev_8_21_14_0_20_45_26]|uniref:Translation initiation factor IF-2 n=1 Tax=Candidatus Abzuiibacterium crystallinum TaxID=1974748 RepID=A0A2H0LPR6_9BACT|nr:MAG: translation initiation factor IF-2 [Candidatus Omnitrophica bacterium CG11_big_fil_rev_8_21_14_0_20_45_26]PIW64365.1 MAG: translation initiation factor IF-2 [Candidatus Omnitrophica bacterium CG12_big_fil_rev_8_21_14_0_65_45_16]